MQRSLEFPSRIFNLLSRGKSPKIKIEVIEGVFIVTKIKLIQFKLIKLIILVSHNLVYGIKNLVHFSPFVHDHYSYRSFSIFLNILYKSDLIFASLL